MTGESQGDANTPTADAAEAWLKEQAGEIKGKNFTLQIRNPQGLKPQMSEFAHRVINALDDAFGDENELKSLNKTLKQYYSKRFKQIKRRYNL